MTEEIGAQQEREPLPPRFRTPAAAKYLGLAAGTLIVGRCTGKLDIPYIKIGRAVVYERAALDQWLAAQPVRRSTSDKAA
jgi:hypothetical protein